MPTVLPPLACMQLCCRNMAGGIFLNGNEESVTGAGLLQVGPSRPSAARRSRQRYTSRCHVADVAQAVLADMRRRTQQQGGQVAATSVGTAALIDVLNVVDDEPAPRGDVEAYAQSMLQEQPQVQASGASRAATADSAGSGTAPPQQRASREPLEEKRVRNTKLKQLLQAHQGAPALLAPSYREGLALILQGPTPFEQVDLNCLYSTL